MARRKGYQPGTILYNMFLGYKMFMVPRKSFKNTKLLESKFKFLHGVLYTKKELLKMNLVDNAICSICNETEETQLLKVGSKFV